MEREAPIDKSKKGGRPMATLSAERSEKIIEVAKVDLRCGGRSAVPRCIADINAKGAK